jgi:hypothetical protein
VAASDPLGTEHPGSRLATRIAFLIAGFGIACWAPLVPFAKARLAVDDALFGLLLLCLGLGSVGTMLLTGILSARYGSKPIILGGCIGLALILPLLSMAATPVTLALELFGFGASLGSLDVAMNIHAVEVERAAQQPLMSGFHALFSVGGFAGSMLMTFLLSVHLSLPGCTLLCSGLIVGLTLMTSPRLLPRVTTKSAPISVLPRGVVVLLAVLAGIAFLTEGAVLDWGALLVTGMGLVTAAHAGFGYVLFSISMTTGRLLGDGVVTRIGDRATLFWGSLIAITGFLSVVLAPVAAVAMLGFLLIGAGASNIVPVLFRRAGSQHDMPAGLAVSAITTVGYAGILLGPAGIGFLAKATSLPIAFAALALLFAVVTLTAKAV